MIRRLLTAMAVLTVALLVVAPSANAQDVPPPAYPPGTCGFVLDPPVIALGGEVHVVGAGFEPGSTVVFEINGIFLGSVIVGADIDGPIDAVFTVPAGLPDGEYIITTSCEGNSFSQSVLVGDAALLCGIQIFTSGATTSLRLPGFQPNTPMTVTVNPGSYQVYSGPTTGNPMTIDVVMPVGLTDGEYQIDVVGTGMDGQPKAMLCAVQGQAAEQQQPPLPVTGSDATVMLVRVGLALLTLGGLLFVIGRKRSAAA